MVRKRPEHLPHAESVAACATEARVSIFDRDLQRLAGVLQADIVGTRPEACQYADASVGHDNLESPVCCGVDDQSRIRPLAMAEDIVLKLAHGSDDGSRERLGESCDDRGLLGTACPESPEIGAIALGLVSPERERARPRPKVCPGDLISTYGVIERYRKRRLERDRGEQVGCLAPCQQDFDERSDSAGSGNAHRTHARQLSGLRRPQQVVGASEVTDQIMSLLLQFAHVQRPRPNERGVLDWQPIAIGCRDRPLSRFHSRLPPNTRQRLISFPTLSGASGKSQLICNFNGGSPRIPLDRGTGRDRKRARPIHLNVDV